MKKTSLAIFAVLLLCVVTLAGCAKADTASLLDCYNLYVGITQEYSSQDKYLYTADTKQVDLYSRAAYNEPAFEAIDDEQGNFKLLKYGKQFQVLTSVALSFYDKYHNYLNMQDIISYEDAVEQAQKTKLYLAIESLKGQCQDILNSKTALVTLCYQDFSIDNINVLQNLERFIKSYKNFMGKALDVSVAFEELYATGMVANVPNGIATGEGERLVESSKLYLAKYIYLQYIQNQDVFFDCSQQQTYLNLIEILNSDAITFSVEPTQSEIYTYNFMCDKLNTFKTGIKNFEVAKQNEQTNDAYKAYVADFEQTVLDFATYVKANLLAD